MKKVFWGNSRFSMWPALFICFFCPQHVRGDGQTKFINLANKGVTPIDIHTSRGSFYMDGLQQLNAALIFSRDHWKDLTGDRPTWFAPTQKAQPQGAIGGTSGFALALSAGGDTLAIGNRAFNGSAGTVYIYTRNSVGTWSLQQQIPDPSDRSGAAQIGNSVALSSDGNTLAAGGPQNNGGRGATWIYTRTNGVWAQQSGALTAGGTNYTEGTSVSLSGDGNTLAAGAPDTTAASSGGVFIYTRSNGVWSAATGKLSGNDAVFSAFRSQQGQTVALSTDGLTLVEGGPNDNSAKGAVWVFVRLSNGLWVQQGAKLRGTTSDAAPLEGDGLAISGDGNTVSFGAQQMDGFKGGFWVFTRTNGVWSQQGPLFQPSDITGSLAVHGRTIALSADGNTLVEAGNQDASNRGAVWLFTRRNGLWTEMGKVWPAGIGAILFGKGLALSADGNQFAGGTGGSGVWIFS